MATDNSGRTITQEMIAGMRRFNGNNVPMKLCYSPSTVLDFEIDEHYQDEHEEEAEIYGAILPAQICDIPYVPAVGEIITFEKQYEGEIAGKHVFKDFVVVGLQRSITQDTVRLSLYTTVLLVPVELP